MGRQSNRQSNLNTHGSHSINNGQLLAATDKDAINPNNPGDLSNVRTVPVLNRVRIFNQAEADVLELQEAQRDYDVKHTKRALRSLGKLENHDANVQTAYRGYQIRVANAELRKVKSNVALGKTLHGQRTQYAVMGGSLNVAQSNADQAVAVVSTRLLGG